MKLQNYSNTHLTYCSNIHPGETWDEVFDQLKSNIPELKSRIAPNQTFGIGLRLSAQAAIQLLDEDRISTFKEWLDKNDLYVFTMNGFPYGNFHRQTVKDLVYTPDWRTQKRLDYTQKLISILSKLLPEGMEGGISTSPLSYKRWLKGSNYLNKQLFRKSSINLAHLAHRMHQIHQQENKDIHLDIEPEPDCTLENSEETIDFFLQKLFPTGSAYLANSFGYSLTKAKEILQRHIRICYDTCHFAVEYENPQKAVEAVQEAGIKIGKTQISAALGVQLGDPQQRNTLAAKLTNFEERTYLHQVIEKRIDGSLKHYADLSEALPHIFDTQAKEWRIHYHVPIFIDQFNGIGSTQGDIKKSLDLLLGSHCNHFEIETYTWEVLPESLKVNLQDSIEREYSWVMNYIGNSVN